MRDAPAGPVAVDLHSSVMAQMALFGDDCAAHVVESKGRIWESGIEIYFRIPEWIEGTVVRVAVGPGITGVDRCWNTLEKSTPILQNGILEYQLGGFPTTGGNVIGCVLVGKLLEEERNIPVIYHGQRCFAQPPPPPQMYEDCEPGQFMLKIDDVWGPGQGWTARLLMRAAEWRAGRLIRLIPPTGNPDSLDGTIATAVVGMGLKITQVFNAHLVSTNRLAIDFTLGGASQVRTPQHPQQAKT